MIKQRKTCIVFIALAVLVALVSVPSALAYFTTYTRIKGSSSVVLGETVTFNELETGTGDKHVTISVDEDSDPVFVRVGIFASGEITNRMTVEGTWEFADGWYTYGQVLKGGETAEMNILINKTDLETEEFNVVVVYEYIPAIVNDAGEFVPDWDAEWTGGGE